MKTWMVLILRNGLLGMIFLAPLILGVAQASPEATGQRPLVVVLTLPWSDPVQDIHAARGWMIGPQRAPFGVLSTSDDTQYRARMADLGYWTVQDGLFARIICGTLI